MNSTQTLLSPHRDFHRKEEEERSTQHIETLKHAAELSRFPLNRSIGPDINLSWVEENENFEEKSVTVNGPVPAQNKNKSSSASPSSRRSLPVDCKTISNAAMYKLFESERKSKVLKEILLRSEVFQNEDEKRRKQYELCRLNQENYLKKKNENDCRLIREAEQFAEQQMQEERLERQRIRMDTEKALQNVYLEAVAQYQSQFRVKYEKIAGLLRSTDGVHFQEVNATLKSSVEKFDDLIGKVKSHAVGSEEVRTAQRLCEDIDRLEHTLNDQIEQLEKKRSAQEQEQRKLELEKQQKLAAEAAAAAATAAAAEKEKQVQLEAAKVAAEAAQAQEQVAAAAAQPTNSSTNVASSQGASEERLQFYNAILAFYSETLERVKPLQNEESMKKYRAACKKVIMMTVNAISGVNPDHLQHKFDRLSSFLSGQAVPTPDGQLSVKDHPLGRDYSLLLMSKEFVNQGGTTVSSNPPAAFAIAKVIVALWNVIPEFGKYFLAYLFKESPFLAPYFIPHKPDQPKEEFLKAWGYRFKDGVLEDQNMYLKRQAGTARLYFAVMISFGRKADGPRHPYGIENGWIWITNIIKLEPLPDICAALIHEFLQIAGSTMHARFGHQFMKVLQVIQAEYVPKLSRVDEGGPKARLDMMLANILKTNALPPPAGQIDRNFW